MMTFDEYICLLPLKKETKKTFDVRILFLDLETKQSIFNLKITKRHSTFNL